MELLKEQKHLLVIWKNGKKLKKKVTIWLNNMGDKK
jgi:hypothetical protein